MYMRCAIRSAREGRRVRECEREMDARWRRAMCRRGSRERLRRGCEVRVRVRRSGMSRKERMWRRSSEGRVGRFGRVVVDMVGNLVC